MTREELIAQAGALDEMAEHLDGLHLLQSRDECLKKARELRAQAEAINGAARPEQAEGVSTDSVVGAIASEGVSLCRPAEVAAVAAAPPEPTPANSEGATDTTTPSQEGPGTERGGAAWVPWEGGECPVPALTSVRVRWHGGIDNFDGPYDAVCVRGWSDSVRAYRLTKPVSRGPCQLPDDHPHAALERLWRSDDTLRCWMRVLGRTKWKELYEPKFDMRIATYHVGHVPPKGAV